LIKADLGKESMTADPNGRWQECLLLSRQGKADKGRALANFRLWREADIRRNTDVS
jgi:hypothetical protein